MDKRRTKSLDGKCGSCRSFTIETGKECTGFCSGRMKQKGRIVRTYKCIGYEAVTTIIPAEPFNNLSKPCKDDDDIPICTKASPASLGIYKKAEEREP